VHSRTNILERLRIDPGQQTLGELLQDREAALHEIRMLRREVDHTADYWATPEFLEELTAIPYRSLRPDHSY